MAVREVDLGNVVGPGVKKINTNLRNFTTAQWEEYGSPGYSSPWTTGSGYDNSHLKIGDIGIVIGTVSDAFDKDGNKIFASIYGTIESVSASSVTMTTIQLVMGSQGQKGDRGPGTNPNLLDNWYFANPVNQRGNTTYSKKSENYTYFIDRWIYGKGVNSINLSSDGVTIDSGDTTYTFIMQRINPTVLDSIKGKTVTMSILVKGNGTVNIGTVNNEQGKLTVNGNDYQLLSCTFVFNNSGNYSTLINCPDIGVAYDAGGADVVTVLAAKLELGDTQTLARQDAAGNWVLNDPPPDYATELLKCQRYFWRMEDSPSNVAKTAYGVAFLATTSATKANLYVPLAAKMRVNPAVTIKEGISFNAFNDVASVFLSDVPSTGNATENGVTIDRLTYEYDAPTQPSAPGIIPITVGDEGSCIILNAEL